jgi:hypothetical protein
MTDSKTSETDAQDASQDVIQAIEQVDLKTLSYIQLRRLYATVMQAVDNLNEELVIRAGEDNAGDTVRVPVPSAAE